MRHLVAILTLCIGCSQPAGEVVRLPIAPAQPKRVSLDLEDEAAHVHLIAPAGFNFQELEGVVFGTRREDIGDPRILIQSIATDLFTHERKPYKLRGENCDWLERPSGEWHVLSRIPEPEGVTLVCEQRSAKRISTVVARELTWHGHAVQCEIRFSIGDGDDNRYAEPTPSKARISDAIEVCKSMQLRGIVAEQP